MKNSDTQGEIEFEMLFNEHWHKLYAFAYNILKEKEAAEDCIQNVFVDYWKRHKKTEVLNAKAYLYQSVKYQCARSLTKQKRFNYSFDLGKLITEQDFFIEEKVRSENEALKELYHQISLLPEKCQQVFRFSKFDKKSNKEIASELGISVSTVENHMNKALKLLRNSLPEHLYVILLLLL
ncbi:RNA polymerase sigma factor [Aquimarina sp. M1]